MIVPTGDYIIEHTSANKRLVKQLSSTTYEDAFLIGQQNISEEYPYFRILKVMYNSTDKVKERWE